MSDGIFQLVSVPEVMDELGQAPDLAGELSPVIFGAITRATLKLEGMMGTRLVPTRTVTDTFFVDPTAGACLNEHYRFRLNNGLLRKELPVVVSVSEQMNTGYTEASESLVDRDVGLVQLAARELDKKYVSVTYTCGFMEGDEVPDAIKHALFMLVPQFILSSSTAQLDPKQAAIQNRRIASLMDLSEDLWRNYQRRIGAFLKPIFSMYVPYDPPPTD